MYGPPLPTFPERCQDLDFQSEDIPLYLLARAYRPDAATLEWIQGHVDGRTSEGPRVTAKRFWHTHPSVSPNS